MEPTEEDLARMDAEFLNQVTEDNEQNGINSNWIWVLLGIGFLVLLWVFLVNYGKKKKNVTPTLVSSATYVDDKISW